PSLEAYLRQLFARQQQLREQLEAVRAELDCVNADVLRAQEEFCTSPEREDEYNACLQRILGFDSRIDPQEIEEAKKDPRDAWTVLAELEAMGTEGPGAGNG